jgi:outer membrane lipoprotein-sorting protein
MAALPDPETDFARLLAGLPFDDAPRPEAAERLRAQVLARFEPAAGPWWRRALHEGRLLMRRPIPRLIAATACLAVFAAWLLLPGRQSTASAFERLAAALVDARTARFQMEVTIEGQPQQKFKAFYLAPDRFRQELPFLVNISNFSAGKMISLMPSQKRALVMNLKGVPADKQTNNYFERLRDLLAGQLGTGDKAYVRLGDKEIDGKQAVGFRYDSPMATVTLWGDPRTATPVRIDTIWSGLPRTEVSMDHFEINVPLKESLFDMTPPADYKVQAFDVDASPPREQDMVEGLRVCSDLGGQFPETLDTAGITKLITRYAVQRGKDFSEETVQQLMKESIKIGRAFQFALELPESADAHYAGKGAKRGDKDRPIFWYKPAGTERYRVLTADLTFHDTERAPVVAGAMRIEKASKTTRSPQP